MAKPVIRRCEACGSTFRSKRVQPHCRACRREECYRAGRWVLHDYEGRHGDPAGYADAVYHGFPEELPIAGYAWLGELAGLEWRYTDEWMYGGSRN